MTEEKKINTDNVGAHPQHQRKIDASPSRTKSHRSRLSLLRDFFFYFVVPLAIVALLRIFVFGAFIIPSGSMENTLMINDRVVTFSLAGTVNPLRRGDIVVFHDPDHWLRDEIGAAADNSNAFLIKRLIGIPGDRVSCAGPGAPVMINGHPIDEKSYLKPGVNPSNIPFNVVVPPGMSFVLGDNRAISADSRYHLHDSLHGFVPLKDIVGTAQFVYWPIQQMKILHDPTQVYAHVGGIPYVYKNGRS